MPDSQPTTLKEATLKERVAEFWKWFPSVSQRYYQAIEESRFEELLDEFSAKMSALLYDMAWVFGPGADESSHSLTISGECVAVKQLIAKYWRECAVETPGWTFYGSRQPSDPEKLAEMEISVSHEKSVDTENFLLKVRVNDEIERIDLIAWHESLRVVPREHHDQILFLLIDEALGEFGSSMWLGDISIKPIKPEKATVNLVKLREHVEKIVREKGWERLPPLEEYTVYQLPEKGDFPRGDTIVGISCIPDVIFELIENNGTLNDDPIEGTGAELVYIQLDIDVFPEGSQSNRRGEIEDKLEEHLVEHRSGYTLGGAFGEKYGYIDLILFDGDHSRDLVKKVLTELHLADKARLVSFC